MGYWRNKRGTVANGHVSDLSLIILNVISPLQRVLFYFILWHVSVIEICLFSISLWLLLKNHPPCLLIFSALSPYLYLLRLVVLSVNKFACMYANVNIHFVFVIHLQPVKNTPSRRSVDINKMGIIMAHAVWIVVQSKDVPLWLHCSYLPYVDF